MLGHRFTVVFRHARLAPSDQLFRAQQCLSSRGPLYQAIRCYATPGRPKKAVGEPSRPVKRAVKRAAKAPVDPNSPAAQQLEAKKKAAAEKKAAGGAKETKATTASKKPKARAATKKPTAKKAQPKEQTDEEKARKAVRVKQAELRALKAAALSPPKESIRISAYTMFTKEKSDSIKGHREPAAQRALFAENTKKNSAEWKQLTPADIEHYNHLAHTVVEARQATYKSWVEQHSPEQIKNANRARAQLRRKLPVSKGHQSPWPAIRDERAAKQPVTAFAQFVINRNASGDFKNILGAERMKLIAEEWRALDGNEKKKYNTLFKQDSERYVEDYSNTYGHAPPSVSSGMHHEHEQPLAAAAAA